MYTDGQSQYTLPGGTATKNRWRSYPLKHVSHPSSSAWALIGRARSRTSRTASRPSSRVARTQPAILKMNKSGSGPEGHSWVRTKPWGSWGSTRSRLCGTSVGPLSGRWDRHPRTRCGAIAGCLLQRRSGRVISGCATTTTTTTTSVSKPIKSPSFEFRFLLYHITQGCSPRLTPLYPSGSTRPVKVAQAARTPPFRG
jgi:hypothetical protein